HAPDRLLAWIVEAGADHRLQRGDAGQRLLRGADAAAGQCRIVPVDVMRQVAALNIHESAEGGQPASDVGLAVHFAAGQGGTRRIGEDDGVAAAAVGDAGQGRSQQVVGGYARDLVVGDVVVDPGVEAADAPAEPAVVAAQAQVHLVHLFR